MATSEAPANIATVAAKIAQNALTAVRNNKEIVAAAFLITDALFGIFLFKTRGSKVVGIR